jgi:hypothetical protein
MSKIRHLQKTAEAVSSTKRCGSMLHIYRHQIQETTVPSEVISIPDIQSVWLHESPSYTYQHYTTVFYLKGDKEVNVKWPSGRDTTSWRSETEDKILKMLEEIGTLPGAPTFPLRPPQLA